MCLSTAKIVLLNIMLLVINPLTPNGGRFDLCKKINFQIAITHKAKVQQSYTTQHCIP